MTKTYSLRNPCKKGKKKQQFPKPIMISFDNAFFNIIIALETCIKKPIAKNNLSKNLKKKMFKIIIIKKKQK